MIVTLLGFLPMAYISIGMLASSITENQIIAGIITIAFFIANWFMPNFISSLSNFSLINVYTNTFPTGTITISALALLVSSTVLFTVLTILLLQRKKSAK